MTFPATANEGAVHHEQNVKYVFQAGRWIQGGVKGLPMVSSSDTRISGRGDLKTVAPRRAKNLIVCTMAFSFTERSNVRIRLWDHANKPLDLGVGAGSTGYRIQSSWGDGGHQISDMAQFGSPNIDGVVMNDHTVLPDNSLPQFLEVRIFNNSDGWGEMQWRWTGIGEGTPYQLFGSFENAYSVQEIGAIGLHFDQNSNVETANLLTQWW